MLSRLCAGGVGWQRDSAREEYIPLTSTAVFDTLSESDTNSVGAGRRLGERTEAGKKLTHIKTKVGRDRRTCAGGSGPGSTSSPSVLCCVSSGVSKGYLSTEGAGRTDVRRLGIRADVGTMQADRGTGREGGCGSDSRKSSCEERGRGDLTQGRRWGARN